MDSAIVLPAPDVPGDLWLGLGRCFSTLLGPLVFSVSSFEDDSNTANSTWHNAREAGLSGETTHARSASTSAHESSS
jgi:hypothetical protein